MVSLGHSTQLPISRKSREEQPADMTLLHPTLAGLSHPAGFPGQRVRSLSQDKVTCIREPREKIDSRRK